MPAKAGLEIVSVVSRLSLFSRLALIECVRVKLVDTIASADASNLAKNRR